MNTIKKQYLKNIKKLKKHPIDEFGFKYNIKWESFGWWSSMEFEDLKRNKIFCNTAVDPNQAALSYALIGWEY